MVTSLARVLVLAAVMVHARHPVKRKRHDNHQDGEQSNEPIHDGRV